MADQLHLNRRLLENHQRYVCFRRDPEGGRAQQILNAGLKKIDIAAAIAKSIKKTDDKNHIKE